MLTKERVVGILRRELPYLRASFGVKSMGLFGSFAKGVEREDSDIDLLVEFEKPIGLNFIGFGEYIEKLLGKKVDILTSEGVKSIRLKKVAQDIERGVFYV
jgi:predicted nucleotidyltransferase